VPADQVVVGIAAVAVGERQAYVPGIIGVGRTVRRVRDLEVAALVALQQRAVGRYGRQRRVPGRAVVQAGLPGMHDRGQTAARGVPAPRQILLLRDEARIEPVQCDARLVRASRAVCGRPAVDLPRGDRV
jgi:hypothetical protein